MGEVEGKAFTAVWRISVICPVYKGKGKPGEPGNCRGITLLSALGKMYSFVLFGKRRLPIK